MYQLLLPYVLKCYVAGISRRSFIPEAGLLRREPGGVGRRGRDLATMPARGVRPAPAAAGQLRAQDTNQDEHDLRGSALQSVRFPRLTRVLFIQVGFLLFRTYVLRVVKSRHT